MSKKTTWFSYDIDTGDVVAKTEIKEDGTVRRYEYTEPDNIKAGHGDKWYDNLDKFMKDEPTGERDKNDPASINRPWFGNGFDLGINNINQIYDCYNLDYNIYTSFDLLENNCKKLTLKR